MTSLDGRARRVRLAAFDVDGVLTDGTVWLDDAGREFKGFSILDGLGLKMLAGSGVRLAIITGRRSRVVELRAAELGIALLRQGVSDKVASFAELLSELGLEPAQASYMGDDLPDLPVLRRCGLAITVPGAPELVRAHAHLVTAAPGGRGAVREACEYILRAQGRLEAAQAAFLA